MTVSSEMIPYKDLVSLMILKIDEVLKPLLPSGATCALLNFPNHSNVGDSAIWLGETTYLRSLDTSVVYTCEVATYSRVELAKRLKGGTIFLHGGGNLGDLWPYHQRFRERVISEFRDAKIVQLPQSIHFKEKVNLERARVVFNQHPDLTLLVRDQHSLELARNEFRVHSYLCPDMAFVLRDIPRPEGPTREIVWLSRTDRESSLYSAPIRSPGAYQTDWLEDSRSLIFRADKILTRRVWSRMPALWDFSGPLYRAYDRLARERLLRGCRVLSKGQVVATDRLHGHILSLLMGIPHVMLSDSYGKLKNFYETWTKNCELTIWANSLEEALGTARSLAQGLNQSSCSVGRSHLAMPHVTGGH